VATLPGRYDRHWDRRRCEVRTETLEPLREELSSLREEVVALRKKSGEMEQRIRRLEVREKILESPASAGDGPVDFR
jgi:prefoldin subunit 5